MKQILLIIGAMLLFFAAVFGIGVLFTDRSVKEFVEDSPPLMDLGFIYLHFMGIIACYYAVYGFMPTVRAENVEPASLLAKIRDYIVCAICVGFLGYLLSYRHGEPNGEIALTRFAEFILPAFYGMYRANRKDADLSRGERKDIYDRHKSHDSGFM